MNTVCDAVQVEFGIKSKFSVVKLDETDRWTPDIAARAGKVFGVYLFDANSPACGEFECLFVESQFTNPALPDREADWLAVEISERDDHADPVRYLPCALMDSLAQIEEGDLTEGVIDLGIEDEDEAFEYLRLRSV